jgi:hypothetical protein
MREAGAMRGEAGRGPLDCRVAALLAMTTQKYGGCPNDRWIAASLRSSQ